MVVGLFGNMNNNFFSLCRYLRDQGIDARLFLMSEQPHFLPEADTFNPNYKEYTFQLNWYKKTWWKISKAQIKKDIEGIDFFITTDWTPSYLQKAGVKPDLFIPHGSDLFDKPFYKFKRFIPKRYEIGSYLQSKAQLKGINNCSYFMMEQFYSHLENFFFKLNFKGERLYQTVPMVYIEKESTRINLSENLISQLNNLKEFKKKGGFNAIYHSRHAWIGDALGFNKKGTEIILRGIKQFIFKFNLKPCDFKLITFEYGVDLVESKKLIKELGIEGYIYWLPLTSRKELLSFLEISNVSIGQVGKSALTNGVILETLAYGVPLISNRDDSKYSYRKNLYPMWHADDLVSVVNSLENVYFNREKALLKGKKGKEWYKKEIVETSVSSIIKIIYERYKTV